MNARNEGKTADRREAPSLRRDADSRRLIVRDFLVDFMGSLLPGFIFISLCAAVLGPPLALLYVLVLSADQGLSASFGQCLDLFGAIRFEIIFFMLALSYVVGHFFFRQTPKRPDERSVSRNERDLTYGSEDEPQKLECSDGTYSGDGAVRFLVRSESQKPGKGEEPQVEFPYRFLFEYLTDRGLHHLAGLVPWQGAQAPKEEGGKRHVRRTKAFINILKTRLEFVFPEKCGTITRNEAHVRLFSSMWYLTRDMIWVGCVGILLSAVVILLTSLGLVHCERLSVGAARLLHASPIAVSALVLAGVAWAKRMIEKSLHYQRVREIVFVLETFYMAGLDYPQILQGIEGIRHPNLTSDAEDEPT